jgi:hypothetical protein
MGYRPLTTLLLTHNNKNKENPDMCLFEPMISVFERQKTVYALNNAAAVIGRPNIFHVNKDEIY